MDMTKKSAKRKAALIILSWAAAVVGDASTRRWAAQYGYNERRAYSITNEIQRHRLPRDGLQ